MDHRPPRPARPTSYEQTSPYATRPPPQPVDTTGKSNISFGDTERGDRHLPLDPSRPRTSKDTEHADIQDSSRVGRKKSLVKPDREKIEPGHRQWHYRNHVAEGAGRVGVMPSSPFSIFFFFFPGI
jgi:chitin synthase